MPRRPWALALGAALALAACGGGSGGEGESAPLFPSPPPTGVTESRLFDPLQRPDGAVPRQGSGLVLLQLEPAAGPALPPLGDSGGLGADDLWFDAAESTLLALTLDDDSLGLVSALDVADAGGQTLARVDATRRSASVPLVAGRRYRLRFVAAAGPTDPVGLGVWFGPVAAPRFDRADLDRVSRGEPCPACRLADADLGAVDLAGANLPRADLRGAILLRPAVGTPMLGPVVAPRLLLASGAFASADLSGANLAQARLDGALLQAPGRRGATLVGANLSGAGLSGVVLDGARGAGVNFDSADLRAASLVGADLSGANLQRVDARGAVWRGARLDGANLDGAMLDGAVWIDGRVCAAGSVGICR